MFWSSRNGIQVDSEKSIKHVTGNNSNNGGFIGSLVGSLRLEGKKENLGKEEGK